MVLVVDCGKQGLYEDKDGIADGVYTDNVVWKEALLHDDADALQSSVATSNEGPHATQSLAQPPALQATAPALATAGQAQWSEEEYFDEGSGAPATPRIGTPQQPLDRHGADDVDEYGEAPPQASAANAVMSGSAVSAELVDSSAHGVGCTATGYSRCLRVRDSRCGGLLSRLGAARASLRSRPFLSGTRCGDNHFGKCYFLWKHWNTQPHQALALPAKRR